MRVVVVVACGGCRAVMRYPLFGGNIIEHYVYRFVTVGRACLVSDLAIPLLFLCPLLPPYVHLLYAYLCL